MPNKSHVLFATWALAAALSIITPLPCLAQTPVNLALQARVSATSEYSSQYRAQYACDGVIPAEGSQSADLEKCWCVRKAKTGDSASFTLSWDNPVEVSEIVYWGRTSWFLSECWRKYAVYLDDSSEPIAAGELQSVHAPQRIELSNGKAVKASKIRLEFLDSYGGYNPGAAEIMVFSRKTTHEELKLLSGGVWNPTEESLRSLEQEAENKAKNYQELSQGLKKITAVKRHEINATHVYTYHYEGFKPGGGLYTIEIANGVAVKYNEIVPSPTGQILSCDVSWDGQTILFAWRKTEREPYHLWTIRADGTELKQITNGTWHDYDPCWLQDGDIAFLSSRAPQFAYCWHAPVGTLYRMALDGSRLMRLSDNYLNDFTPHVLDDGRIIYSRWEYVDRPAIPIQSLWAIHPDGTGLQGVFGNRIISPGTFMDARPIPGTNRLICVMTGHNGPTRGAIGVINRSLGLNAQAAIENITPDSPVPPVEQGDGNFWTSKPYSSPYPLDKTRFLVSARGSVLIRTYALDESGTQAQMQQTLLPAPTDSMQWFSAQPLEKKARPPILPSSILDSEFIRETGRDADGKTWETEAPSFATLYLQNVYEGLGDSVQRGEVAAVRIVREMQKTVRVDPGLRAFGFQFPVISCGATYAGKMVLGDVPVNPDGSACFRVGKGVTRTCSGYDGEIASTNKSDAPVLEPSTGPIYFIALDKEGRAIQRMRSFTHLMPGEKQTCIGCHESRLSTPVQSAGKPTDMTPVTPVLPAWADAQKRDPVRARFAPGFDYVDVIQPVWDKYCIKCHSSSAESLTLGGKQKNHLDLSGDYTDYFNVSYDCLASENQDCNGSPYISWIPTYNGQENNILQTAPRRWGSYNSKLAQIVRSGHPDAQSVKRFEMNDEDKRKVYAWIDLNVPYYASSETSHLSSLGCRRIYPPNLDAVLAEVGQRRCVKCHQNGSGEKFRWTQKTQNQLLPGEGVPGAAPRRSWVRITQPQRNDFLMAPLAVQSGGWGKCVENGRSVFEDASDPDYQKILAAFEPIQKQIEQNPRIDMPGGKPAENSCRITH